jgi:DNA-binding transcriptional ArsR family regulator
MTIRSLLGDFLAYNIFVDTNISTSEERVTQIFRLVGQPNRVRILLELGRGEACVCHLEAKLGLRQAAISQHLMALRDGGIITARRDGRFMFYQLADPALLDLIRLAARAAGVPVEELESGSGAVCECPKCAPGGSCS